MTLRFAVQTVMLILVAYTSVESGHASVVGGGKALRDINVKILEHAVQAVERVCPRLQFWTLQTGGKVRIICNSMMILVD